MPLLLLTDYTHAVLHLNSVEGRLAETTEVIMTIPSSQQLL